MKIKQIVTHKPTGWTEDNGRIDGRINTWIAESEMMVYLLPALFHREEAASADRLGLNWQKNTSHI